eukprot:6213518-Heterocapsa_arctica.AAC.1
MPPEGGVVRILTRPGAVDLALSQYCLLSPHAIYSAPCQVTLVTPLQPPRPYRTLRALPPAVLILSVRKLCTEALDRVRGHTSLVCLLPGLARYTLLALSVFSLAASLASLRFASLVSLP